MCKLSGKKKQTKNKKPKKQEKHYAWRIHLIWDILWKSKRVKMCCEVKRETICAGNIEIFCHNLLKSENDFLIWDTLEIEKGQHVLSGKMNDVMHGI